MDWEDLMESIKETDTFAKLLKRNYDMFGDKKIALAVKDYGIWQSYTWKDYYENVKYFFMGMRNMGLKQGDKVAILGETKPEAYFAQLAVQAMRGTVIGIFTDCLPDEVKYFISHSNARFILAHDQEQVDKVLEIKNETPMLEKIIYWDPKGLWNYSDEMLISFNGVIDIGKKEVESEPECFETNIMEGKGDDIALFCYSSGTTGDPKGVMLTHKTILGAGAAWACLDDWCETDNYVSFLPLAWVTEQMMIAASLIECMVVNFTESIDTVQEDIRETGPSVLFWGARNWESINRLIQAKITDATMLNRFFYNTFLKVGYRVADADTERRVIHPFWKILNRLGYWIVFRDLLDRVGLSNARNAYTGGAPISPDVVRFFKAIGVNIRVAYGASEFPLISIHRPNDVNPGTSGPPLPHVKVKISDEGEILAKSEYKFAGYHRNPEGLKEKVVDGWYHTGDFGHITEDGHLVVMDRLGDLRELADGTKFSPQYVESRLRFSPYIKDALVTGGREREYVGAIVNIDLDNVGRWAEGRRIPYTTYTDLSQKPEVVELVREDFLRVNRLVPEGSRVKKFLHLHKEFDADDAELTRTRKIKREFMEERYRELIDGLYGNKGEVSVEAPVTYRDGRKGTIRTTIKINEINV